MAADIEAAVEQVAEVIDAKAAPDQMSQSEAIEFYQDVADHCQTWIAAIREDLGEA